ncbi:hypothetical protein AB4156_21040 [Cupriavidus sp. 2MCAB6]|uniref:hypothetical protein n=1 Tax=Cupriavidus sp. 2MCAB6 TaxID=3232981 RepID=UPI003F8EE18F
MMKKWLSAAVCSMMFAGPAAFTLAHAAPAGSKADYDAAVKTANANYKAARAQCDSLKDNAKDVCVKEAKRDEDVAKANAEAARDGTEKARAKADKVKADGDYSVAKEKCDDRKGNDKDVCVKEAKVAHEQALGVAKVEKAAATGTSTDVAEARADARKDTVEAAYKADKEKCDAMSGDAKDKCQANVKAKYAK